MIDKRIFEGYMKMDDKQPWFDFYKKSLDMFYTKYNTWPVSVSMNVTDKLKILGKAKGIEYKGQKYVVETRKTTLHLMIELYQI